MVRSASGPQNQGAAHTHGGSKEDPAVLVDGTEQRPTNCFFPPYILMYKYIVFSQLRISDFFFKLDRCSFSISILFSSSPLHHAVLAFLLARELNELTSWTELG
uniref:Uncharacterized protein n=1 Tax=Setaria viridis TaxID=4556 RepID=A0A4U6UIR7_SETVI|nr:hypothetical protein SEVIR_5G277900v2 [Setaria viridis]